MRVELQYFEGCPSWRQADQLLRQALEAVDLADVEVDHVLVDSIEQAEALGFRGSPTLLIGGVDPFAGKGAAVGFACRLYLTPDGLAGAPTYEQILATLGGLITQESARRLARVGGTEPDLGDAPRRRPP